MGNEWKKYKLTFMFGLNSLADGSAILWVTYRTLGKNL